MIASIMKSKIFKPWAIDFHRPSDNFCGLFGLWLDNCRGLSITVHIFVRAGSQWGYKKMRKESSFGLGPLLLVIWSSL